MSSLDDVLKNLPRLSWRGIEVPVTHRSVRFEHEHVAHKFSYRDGQIVEALGYRNWIFSYTIPFREGMRSELYEHLFTEVHPKFVEACRDRTEDLLIDPVLGSFTARCQSLGADTDPSRRDGEDLQVSFIHSPKPDEEDRAAPTISSDETQQINDAIVEVGSDEDLESFGEAEAVIFKQITETGMPKPPDIFSAIARIGSQIAAQADRFNAQIAKYEHKLNGITKSMEAVNKHLGRPRTMPIIRSLHRFQNAARGTLTQTAFLGQEVASYTVLQDSSPGILAAQLKMGLSAFMLINVALPTPLVPAGTIVKYAVRPI